MKQTTTHSKAVSLTAALLAGILMLIAAAGVLFLPAGAEDIYLEKDNSSTLENGYASYIGTINGMARDEALGADFKQLVTVNDTLTFTGWCIAYNRTVVRYEVKFDDNAWIDAKATLSAYANPDELKNQFIKDNNFDTEKAVFSLTVDTVGMAEGAHTVAIRAVLSDGTYGLILRKTRNVPAEIDFTIPARGEVALEKDNSQTMLNGYASYIGTINGMKRDEALGADFKQLVPVNDTLTFTGWCIAYKRNVVRYEYKLDDGAWTDANATLSTYENPNELKGQFIKDDNFDTEKAVYSLTVSTADLAAGAHTIALRAVMNDGSYGLILRKTRDVPAEIDFTVSEREVPSETETETEIETETATVTETYAAESTSAEEPTAAPTETATEAETAADSAKDSVTGTAAGTATVTGTDTDMTSDSGCGSVIAGSALAVFSMLSLCGFALRKKH